MPKMPSKIKNIWKIIIYFIVGELFIMVSVLISIWLENNFC